MRRSLLVVLLVLCPSPGLMRAQPVSACETCAGAAGCEAKRDACVAECRARLFSVDPRRADCIAACLDTATQCIRSVESFCRAGNRCN